MVIKEYFKKSNTNLNMITNQLKLDVIRDHRREKIESTECFFFLFCFWIRDLGNITLFLCDKWSTFWHSFDS